MGIHLAMGGIINHGIFDILQGSRPTEGLFIEAIGETHRFWVHGTEGAVTLIPNFLVSGIFVLVISIAIIVWTVKYIGQKQNSLVFIALLIVLTLVGGGIGHIVF